MVAGRWLAAVALTMCTVTLRPTGVAAQPAARAVDSVVRPVAAPARGLPSEAASARVTRFSFIVYGDTRGPRDGTEVQAVHSMIVESMLKKIAELKSGPDPVRFVIQSGDGVVNGGVAAQWNVSYTPVVERLTREGAVPYYLVPGNHDVSSADSARAPLRLARLPNYYAVTSKTIPQSGPRRLRGYPTFAFGYGNTFVIGFDSNIAGDTIQFAWVKAQLEHLDRRRWTHVVMFAHHPAYSSGPHGGAIVENSTRIIREKWMPLFRANGVDMFFVGHEHFFEHWAEEWRDAKGAWRRLDQVVTGGGGAPIYTYRGNPDLTAYLAAGARDSLRVTQIVRPGADSTQNPHHYVVVHVDGTKVWQEVIGVDWGRDYAPYRTARIDLGEPPRP